MSHAVEKTQDEQLAIEIARLFPCQGQWTEADYFRLSETNRIMELSEGRLIITLSPTDQHQKISFRLSLLKENHVLSNNLSEVHHSQSILTFTERLIFHRRKMYTSHFLLFSSLIIRVFQLGL